MSLAAWNIERGRMLLWVAATDSFVPASMKDWVPISLDDTAAQENRTALHSSYSVIFEATCNSMLNYDPIIEAQAIQRYFGHCPDVLVAVVAPTLEVPIGAQHALTQA